MLQRRFITGWLAAALLAGCALPNSVSVTDGTLITEPTTPGVSIDADQAAIDQFRQVTGLPDVPLEPLGQDTMINSPHGDLAVTSYQDDHRGRYLVAMEGHTLVEYRGLVLMDGTEETENALSDAELSARAIQIARALVPDFDVVATALEYGEGNKSGLHFYEWRRAGSPEWTMPPFVQVGLLRSGEVFAYSNTIGFK